MNLCRVHGTDFFVRAGWGSSGPARLKELSVLVRRKRLSHSGAGRFCMTDTAMHHEGVDPRRARALHIYTINQVGRAEKVCIANPVGRKEEKMSSFIAKPAEVERKWYVVDAEGKNLGRMASQIAAILRGKNKPTYTPHVDCGDYVIVINAEKVEVTGKKRKEKIYKRHTGYPGGLRELTFEKMMEKHPTEVVRHAVKGMMPNGKLGRQMYKKLKVYAGPEHEHAAQKPEVLDI